eukprot:11245871-Alexandrium_andersonii.AAC.1
MSASLVGSEMCIRDRNGPSGLLRSSETARNRSPAFQRWVPEAPLRCARPVSYTHLTLPTICSV